MGAAYLDDLMPLTPPSFRAMLLTAEPFLAPPSGILIPREARG